MSRKKKRKQFTNKKKRLLIINGFLVLFLFLGLGYSILGYNLNLFGNITVRNYNQTLYGVLETAARKGIYAKEYTGDHNDSMNPLLSTEKIYHWHADDDAEGTEVLNKNNVIFAGQCWQMIRTTDTGGVKMIYNGEAEEGKCLQTRGTHTGYGSRSSQNLVSNYWYGTDYTYDKSNQTFKLSGTTEQLAWNATTGPGLIGKYTCKETSKTATCSTLYLVESYNNETSANVLPLNSNANYSQFGALQYNAELNSPTYVGYMYGDIYSKQSYTMSKNESFTTTQTMLSALALSTNWYYADSVDYGTLTANRYRLVSPYQINSTADYPSLVGKYTLRSTGTTTASSSVLYIAAVSNTTMYYLTLEGGNLLSAYEPIIFGDSITDNGNGTYTINNPTSVTYSDWFANFQNYREKYTCHSNSATCAKPRYVTTATSTYYTYVNADEKIMIGKTRNGVTLTDTQLVTKENITKNATDYEDYKYTCNTESATCTESTLRLIKSINTSGYSYVPNHYFGSSVDWNGTNYTLVDPIDIENYNDYNNLSTHHYMCESEGLKTCPTVAYAYFATGNTWYYITLENGITSVTKAFEDMFTKNTTNSVMKNGVDAWYKHYLLDYDSYIEDTVFCNDRSIQPSGGLGGWDPDGGMPNLANLKFKEYDATNDLSCTNITDRFSVSNDDAKLTYKVGLMTSPEMNIMNDVNARKSGKTNWLLSPSRFLYSGGAYMKFMYPEGNIVDNTVSDVYGVRPAISLKPGIEYVSGTGTMADPYIVSHAKPSTPVFTDSAVVNGSKAITITFPDGCTTPYSCSYSIDHNTPVPVTENSVVLNFTNPAVLTATTTNGTDEVSKDHNVTFNALYVSSSGNDTTGNGTIATPYATLAKAYSMADSTSTIYTMSNLTATETTTFNKNKNITLTSCTKENDTTCNLSTIYSITRGSSFTSGYVLNQTSGTLNLDSIKINGNNVEADKALIYSKGTINLNSGTTITKSKSTALGGGICNSGGTVNLNGATISSNNATKGGGIYNTNNGILNILSGTISNNNASDSSNGNGGGIWTSGPTTISGGTISNNTANTYGGGINCSYDSQNNNCTMIMTGGTFIKNTAERGGAVYINADSQFTMSGGTIGSSSNGNTASTYGGGIYAKGRLEIKQASGSTTRISYNTTPGSGGGIFSGDTLILSGGTINNNEANYGGGIYTNVDATVSLTGSTISNNTSNNSGAGLYTYGTLTMSGGTISSNTASTYGGGIMNKTQMTMTGGTITSNSAQNNSGGGIHSDGNITISGGTIIKNTAGTNGGGVAVGSGNTAVLSGGTIGGSSANKNTAENGGGFYAFQPTSVTLTSPIAITYNEANSYGGGIYVSGGSVTMNSGTINYNSAIERGGGGIAITNNCTMALKGGNIRYNTTSGYNGGGGIGLFGSEENNGTLLTITGGTISNNTANATEQGDGGGIYSYYYTKINMSGGTISQNNANRYGGGIFTYGTLNLSGGTITDNRLTSSTIRAAGGGIFLIEDATVNITGGSITNNKVTGTGGFNVSGGGIASSAHLSIKQASGKTTEISGNTVTNTSTATGANATGAGVYCNSSDCTMTGGTISSNTVTDGYGGGIYITSNGTFKLSGGSITGNSATKGGGGIYKTNAGVFTKTGSPTCTNNGQSGLSSACAWTAN